MNNKYMIKKALRCIMLFSLLFILLISCEISSFHDEVVERVYSFDTLNMLNVKSDIHVILIQDSSDFIRIMAPEGMHDGIVPEIKYDTVIIKNKNRSKIINRYNQKVTAEVHFTDFKIFFFQGGGNVTSSDTLRMKNFSIWSNGATGIIELNVKNESMSFGLSTGNLDIELYGETEDLNLWTTSYCNIYLLNLDAKRASVRNNSTMDCYINVLDELNARVEYMGNIYYKGDPARKEIVETGSGRVLKIN